MAKASIEEVGNLHGLVTRALCEAVQGSEDADGNPVPPSAAILAVAIGFLKANSVTADVGKDKGLQELRDTLQSRRKQRPALTLADADDLTAGLRGTMQ